MIRPWDDDQGPTPAPHLIGVRRELTLVCNGFGFEGVEGGSVSSV